MKKYIIFSCFVVFMTANFPVYALAQSGPDSFGSKCVSGIINGRVYKVETSPTVYLAENCQLRPFRDNSIFNIRGHKFNDIAPLQSLDGIDLTDQSALPSGGTLIKGVADKTVWFVTEEGQRRGFADSNSFRRLGFNFESVRTVADATLNEMPIDSTVIKGETMHPSGSLIKCGDSKTVYLIKGNIKLAFPRPEPYLDRGHTWDSIAVVDCSKFIYPDGAVINR